MEHCEGGPYPFPVFFILSGLPCLVVGGGTIAVRKAADLAEAGALLTIVALEPSHEMERFAADSRSELVRRGFEDGDVEGMRLVFAATDVPSVNRAVAEAAGRRTIPVNVVDTPELCTFISGAVVKRGPLRIAVSTSGCCPGLAADIRRDLEERYPEKLGFFIGDIGELRRRIVNDSSVPEHIRHDALAWLIGKEARELYETSGKEALWRHLKTFISD